MEGKLTTGQRKLILKAIESDSAIFDFEGLPSRTQDAVIAMKDYETLEHDATRYICDYVFHRNSQKSFW